MVLLFEILKEVDIAMKPSTIRYFIREGFGNVSKNMLMTAASILAVSACISLLTFSYTISVNISGVLNQMEDSIGISVFLDGEPISSDIDAMRKSIEGIIHVQDVKYISPDDALEELKESWGSDEDIFDGLDSSNNPLSHSLQISIYDIEYQGEVLRELEKLDGIANIRHGQTETDLIMSVSQAINISSIVVMIILGIVSIMIIVNTIRISVANRRVEINIMKYVGATDWFIRWPFILEGGVIGFIGASIPIALGIPIYSKTIEMIYSFIPMLEMIRFKVVGDIYMVLAPLAMVFGIGLGVFGSVTAIKKHLKV